MAARARAIPTMFGELHTAIVWGEMNSWAMYSDWAAGGRAWFGFDVLDGLIQVVDRHVEGGTPRRLPAAIGCVPWFSHRGLAQSLARLSCCIVVNKPQRSHSLSVACRELQRKGEGLNTSALPLISDKLPKDQDGKAAMIGPYDTLGAEVGPVRIAGYTQSGLPDTPLLHSKILVLGHLWEDDDCFTGESFVATHVWLGSANWTYSKHLEFGVLTQDRKLVNTAKSFVSKVIGFSEPHDSLAQIPQPELATVRFDDAAFSEIMSGLSGLDDEDSADG